MTQIGTQPDKILVVDDEALLRSLACDLLEDAGFSVIEAANAAQALQILEERADVGLLFTDVQMAPGIDGMELARQVHDQWPNILLLVTSADSDQFARLYRYYLARDSEMISPTCPI